MPWWWVWVALWKGKRFFFTWVRVHSLSHLTQTILSFCAVSLIVLLESVIINDQLHSNVISLYFILSVIHTYIHPNKWLTTRVLNTWTKTEPPTLNNPLMIVPYFITYYYYCQEDEVKSKYTDRKSRKAVG